MSALNDGSILNPLAEFEVGLFDDSYNDPPLVHTPCGKVICTLENEGGLDVLVRTALAHLREACSA